MSKVRRLIVPVACAWLLLHVSVVAGTTILLVSTGTASDLVCTCTHGDHGTCPMHRKPVDESRCRMQGTQDGLGAALLSILGPLTIPVTSATVVVDAMPSRPIAYQPPLLSDRAVSPDPPPPRH